MESKSAQSRNLFVAAWSFVPVMRPLGRKQQSAQRGGRVSNTKSRLKMLCLLFLSPFMYNVNATYTSFYEVGIGDGWCYTTQACSSVDYGFIWHPTPPALPDELYLFQVLTGWERVRLTWGFCLVRALWDGRKMVSFAFVVSTVDWLTVVWLMSAGLGWNSRCYTTI